MASQEGRLEIGVWGADSAQKHRDEAPRIGKAIPNRNIVLNLRRRHLAASQQGCLATEILPMLEAEAKARQVANLRQGTKIPVVAKLPPRESAAPMPEPSAKADDKPPAILPEPINPSPPIEPPKPADTKSRDIAAKQMNVAPRYVSDAKTFKAANRVPRFVPPTCADRVPQSDTPPGRNSVNTKEYRSVAKCGTPCKWLIYRERTATNQKAGRSNRSGRTIKLNLCKKNTGQLVCLVVVWRNCLVTVTGPVTV